ncbi:LysR family transcriptional regulator [Pectobacterium araliae]|uniref:LysR family transcriptional regulator n=1 Tax=Pectobacterium araliae TaxID=3073862 RepID=A0AAN0KCE5_9GAMM|nr:LysR family transcriptional regulator [Pectobacterium sp. MAFF 302110]GKW21330.1 LysR family transcriptional regulator [Pectobacterium carotovorum subsp. carotovorum]
MQPTAQADIRQVGADFDSAKELGQRYCARIGGWFIEDGLAVRVSVPQALEELEGAVTDAVQEADRPSGLLRLNVARVAAIHYLAPILGGFLSAFLDITVDVVTDDRLIDIVAERFDAGMRLGEKLHRDMVAVRLSGDLEMKVVASPAYLVKAGYPRKPQDLVRHRCLTYRRPSDNSVYRWEFQRQSEQLEVHVKGALIVDEPAMPTQISLDGAGIAYQFAHQVDPFLENGQLIQLLKDWTPAFPGFYVYYTSRRQMIPPLRAFLDFLAKGHSRSSN